MRAFLLAVMFIASMPASACRGAIGISEGAYAATSKEAMQQAFLASKTAGSNLKGYHSWLDSMVNEGHLIFIKNGTRLCVSNKAEGIVRVFLQGRAHYMAAAEVTRL